MSTQKMIARIEATASALKSVTDNDSGGVYFFPTWLKDLRSSELLELAEHYAVTPSAYSSYFEVQIRLEGAIIYAKSSLAKDNVVKHDPLELLRLAVEKEAVAIRS